MPYNFKMHMCHLLYNSMLLPPDESPTSRSNQLLWWCISSVIKRKQSLLELVILNWRKWKKMRSSYWSATIKKVDESWRKYEEVTKCNINIFLCLEKVFWIYDIHIYSKTQRCSILCLSCFNWFPKFEALFEQFMS